MVLVTDSTQNTGLRWVTNVPSGGVPDPLALNELQFSRTGTTGVKITRAGVKTLQITYLTGGEASLEVRGVHSSAALVQPMFTTAFTGDPFNTLEIDSDGSIAMGYPLL